MSAASTGRVLGRGIAALVRTCDNEEVPTPVTPSTPSIPIARIGQVTIPHLGVSGTTYAVGRDTTGTSLFFLVDAAGDRDAFGNPCAKVVEFGALASIDLVQAVGELVVRTGEQEKLISELQEKVRLAACRQRD